MHVGVHILCKCTFLLRVTVHLTVFMHSCLFLHLVWMQCTVTCTVSSRTAITSPSVTASELREGTEGGELYLTLCSSERVLRGTALEWTIVKHWWVVMDTRPPLVKPRCPCFIRHPTGSPDLLISGFRQLAPRPSSTSQWPLMLTESSSQHIFSFLTDGYIWGGLR